MPSDPTINEAFVWTWLPGQTDPVVAGKLAANGSQFNFIYGQSYLKRKDALALYEPELPLKPGVLAPMDGLSMPNCIRDASPDAWGRRVIINRFGTKRRDIDPEQLDELSFLLESGSDRGGALDFQLSAKTYAGRQRGGAPLAELLRSVALVEAGTPLTPELDVALFHGSSIGGARPKATITSGNKKYIAKFSSQNDVYSVVKAEFIAMRLAREIGLSVAPVQLERASGKDVLLIERFDRTHVPGGWTRSAFVSALTMLGLDEMMAQYASYEGLATLIRHRFREPKKTLHELFSRILFNILCGNTDDHARNHAAFWSGHDLSLTPAYDICPQNRTGGEATQAMRILGTKRNSQIALCLDAATVYQVSKADALAIAAHQVRTICKHWKKICREASLSEVDRDLMWRRQFLHPYAFEGAPPSIVAILDE